MNIVAKIKKIRKLRFHHIRYYLKLLKVNLLLRLSGDTVNVSVMRSQLICNNDKLAKDILLKGSYEPGTTKLLAEVIETTDYFIDVGANIGYYSVILGKINPSCDIISFEPEENNFRLFQQNIELNNLNNVIAHKKGVSSKNGHTDLYVGEKLYHSIDPDKMLSTKQYVEKIIIVSLDQIIPFENTKKYLVKIDVEGHEIEVLRGMIELIQSVNLTLVIEYIKSNFNEEETKWFFGTLQKYFDKILVINELHGNQTPINQYNQSNLPSKLNLYCTMTDKD